MWPDCIYFITVMIYCCVLMVYNTLYPMHWLPMEEINFTIKLSWATSCIRWVNDKRAKHFNYHLYPHHQRTYYLSLHHTQGVSKMLGQTSGVPDKATGKHFTEVYVQKH
jgi:hypothetical protein